MALEIERKFQFSYLKTLPFLMTSNFKREEIIQSYIEKSEEKEFRVRKITEFSKDPLAKRTKIYFTKTEKFGSGFAREEVESEISEEEYLSILENQIGTVKKIRFTLPDEVSCFDYYPFISLITFEKEFETEEIANSFEIPTSLKPYFVQEITGNKDYSNFKLAKIYENLNLEK